MKPAKIVVIGAGSRGTSYSTYATQHPNLAKIVGVAEPREFYRQRMKETHQIPSQYVFTDWKEAANQDRFADAVIIATQDKMHTEPAIAFAQKGYHLLLEKPMAPSEHECRAIVKAALDTGIIFAVCHVLRYTSYTKQIKELLHAGTIGEVVSIQHIEPVRYWHQAHSYVRGNWRNSRESSFMLLAKSCHDLDWIRYMMDAKCEAVSSFGSLKLFRKEEKPQGAADRCFDCGIESMCPYSAKKIYLGRLRQGRTGWPVDVLTPTVTEEDVTRALQTGPYGRCVYACDNDVVDNQVVNMLFEGGKTACFTMTAFTGPYGRTSRIFGTRGEIFGNSRNIEVFDFLTDKSRVIDTQASDDTILGGHGGGDYGLMQSFVAALNSNDPGKILSGPEETLETHLMVFAAEKARLENGVVEV